VVAIGDLQVLEADFFVLYLKICQFSRSECSIVARHKILSKPRAKSLTIDPIRSLNKQQQRDEQRL
jgi:hypothetical protein